VLSHTSDYALRAALVLGRAYGRQSVPVDDVAEATGAPRNYLAKVLNSLAKAGLVTSARGPSGGFALASPPESITLAAIIDQFDEPHHHTRCLLGNGPCTPNEPCSAHTEWIAVLEARRAPLLRLTLADLLNGRTSHRADDNSPHSHDSSPSAAVNA
jgi:Rrf2 family iron-sulfur cluster assembly transcriptional regulator